MKLSYGQEKTLFYSEIRSNPLVDTLNAEPVIRDLAYKIQTYVNHANLAFNDILENPSEHKINVSFLDIGRIAYEESVYRTRNPIVNFLKGHGIENKVKEYSIELNKIEKSKITSTDFLKNNIIKDLENITEYENTSNSNKLNKLIFEKANDYKEKSRQFAKLDLANIPILLEYQNTNILKKDKRLSKLNLKFKIPKDQQLSQIEIKSISKLCQRYARMCEYAYETLYATYLVRESKSLDIITTDYNEVIDELMKLKKLTFNQESEQNKQTFSPRL